MYSSTDLYSYIYIVSTPKYPITFVLPAAGQKMPAFLLLSSFGQQWVVKQILERENMTLSVIHYEKYYRKTHQTVSEMTCKYKWRAWPL